ncbi:radical SAM protein [Clostridium sp. 19966]|uniref:radical SAM protein n=1 Tax=Clostridium sp. 19966 TaxID=2768166 RepID=UPI0028DDA7EA|nr:radical SAM protein [Clostridium sp. 19966]MDT8718330.1 radical SAM protein [Clostridium sp. 19966]
MKAIELLEKSAKETMVKNAVALLSKSPEENFEKLFDLVEKAIGKDEENLKKVQVVRDVYHNNEATHKYIIDMLKETDKKCLQTFFSNFLANNIWYGIPKRDKLAAEKGLNTPFVILISPSMRCNLKCTGCYASSYSKEEDIPYEELERIVSEARDLGLYFFIILGGEPFFRYDLLKLYEKFNDCIFVPFTNGTLFDEKLSDKLVKLANVVPMFSLEGFEKDTDARRGKGVFQKVMKGMELLKERGVMFGVSTAVSKNNIDTVVSDSFIDMLVEKGSRISWYFIFMPVGKNPEVNLMLSPKQRIHLGERVGQIRANKPYFAIDFFNDAPYVGGCIAGKEYCHINSKEELEPCIFSHFSAENLKNKSFIEAFNSDFFKEIRSRQPYNNNLLMPCMMIDNTNQIREIVAKTGAKPTDEGGRKMIEDKEFQKKLDEIANDFFYEADKAWKNFK